MSSPWADQTPTELGLNLGELRAIASVLGRADLCGGKCGNPECEVLAFAADSARRKISAELAAWLPDDLELEVLERVRDFGALATAQLDQRRAELVDRGLL